LLTDDQTLSVSLRSNNPYAGEVLSALWPMFGTREICHIEFDTMTTQERLDYLEKIMGDSAHQLDAREIGGF